ncbi:hypothetical protein [Neptuniibacter sp.]|uniref:hypothetical protein n=1 Tax=Neptuniibacter sp. TaxID=1962643 RepID=UPI002626A59B|nr:hypothetical protein [Neptuniibacter sp.]MCP4595439.1 hypothetical protein [Neptuniibacter sp.]
MFASLIVLLIILTQLQIREWCRVVLLLVTSLCVVAGTLFAFYGLYHLDSARLGNQVYHLAYDTMRNGLTKYWLCECESTGTFCDRHSFYIGDYYPEPTELIVDEKTNELNVWIGNELIYTHGDDPRCHIDHYSCWIID